MSIIDIGDILTLVKTGETGIKSVFTALNNWQWDQNNFSQFARLANHEYEKNDYRFAWNATLDLPGSHSGGAAVVSFQIPEFLGIGALVVDRLQAVTLRDSITPLAGTTVEIRRILKGETTAEQTDFTIAGAWVLNTPREDSTGTLLFKSLDTLEIRVTTGVGEIVDPLYVTVYFRGTLLGSD